MLWRAKGELTEAQKVCKRLNSDKKEDREWTEQYLRHLGPNEIPTLLDALVAERGNRKRKTVGRLLGVISILYVMVQLHFYANSFQLIGMLAALFAATSAQKSLAQAFTRLEDVRVVGALAEALEYRDREIAHSAAYALIRLLPRLKASDAHLLDTEQRLALYRALNGKRPELVVAILHALEQIGDSAALPYVEKLAHGKGHTAGDLRIPELAQELIPVLTQRAEEDRVRHTLLRAATPTESLSSLPDTLLRPASGITPTEPQELLRAISSAAAESPHTVLASNLSAAGQEPEVLTAGSVTGP